MRLAAVSRYNNYSTESLSNETFLLEIPLSKNTESLPINILLYLMTFRPGIKIFCNQPTNKVALVLIFTYYNISNIILFSESQDQAMKQCRDKSMKLFLKGICCSCFQNEDDCDLAVAISSLATTRNDRTTLETRTLRELSKD